MVQNMPFPIAESIKNYLESEDIQSSYDGFKLDLNRLCDKLSVSAYNALFKEKLDGMILKEGSKFTIYVNKLDPETRKRFTLAHELGHFISHMFKSYSHSKLEQGSIEDPAYMARSENKDCAELEADEIAGHLLMPEKFIKILLEQKKNEFEMARIFNVSVEALKIRLRNLNQSQNLINA